MNINCNIKYGFDQFIIKRQLYDYNNPLIKNNKIIVGAYIQIYNLNKRSGLIIYIII